MQEIKRLSAKKVRISDVLSGRFFPGNKEDMKASYVITPFGENVSRVNIIGTIVEKFESENKVFSSITLDDESESIRVKFFKESVNQVQKAEPGELVTAIGKIKEYNGEIYINGEFLRKEKDFNLYAMKKLEILRKLVERKKIVEKIKGLSKKMEFEELKKFADENFGLDEEALKVILETELKIDYKPKILSMIESLQGGEGVEIGKIFEITNLSENVVERTIDELLNEGLIFEPKPGILKKI